MAEILKKDPVVYQRERESFIRDLKHFHEARGTPIRRLPCVNGREFDLYLLYMLVTNRGGWVKVNQRNEWTAVLNQLGSFTHCVNGQVALKQIYLRYLDRYEKIHFLGETLDRNVDDDEDSRHKRFSARNNHNQHQPVVPHQYNYHQHIVPDSVRANSKLSQNLYHASEYDKLALSLLSPLPNEQDFAINVCALLSGTNNEGKNTTLKLCNHPRLLHYLLAHAAVYNHHSLRALMEENYKEVRGYSLKYFWSDVVEDKELSILMDEKKHVKRRPKPANALPGAANASSTAVDEYDGMQLAALDDNQKYGDDDPDCRLKLLDEDKELFCVGRSYGTQDFVGQRVLQVAMILRNATFIEENVPTLARDSTFLRFVLLCCGSRWSCLHQLGFDMLSNIAHEIILEDSLVEHILRIVCQGLESLDRTVILACVEILNKLGQKEENEDTMLRCIEQKVYSRICSFLSLQDIMLLIHTLECLYSLSSLGEKACNAIVHVSGAVDSLVSLITVEAQSYGPKACILMRVVETVTGDPQETDGTPLFASPAVSHSLGNTPNVTPSVTVNASGSFVLTSSSMTAPLVSSVPSMVATSIPNASTPIVTVSSLLQATPLPTPAVASPVVMPAPVTHSRPATPQRVLLPATSVAMPCTSAGAVSVVVSTNAVASTTTLAPVATTMSVATNPAVVTTQQENENFATQWLRNTFETHTQPGRGIEQGEMYKLYLTACSRAGRRGVIAPLHFPQCVRSVFGANVGPRQVVPANATGTSETSTSKLFVYEGLQVRAKPFNVTVTPSTLTQSARTPSSPILKAQLSSPSPPNITKKDVKSKVSSSHPHLSNVLLNAGTSPVSMPPLKTLAQSQTTVAVSPSTSSNDSSNSTSLIKSLLASKVGDFVSPKASANLKNDKSVLTAPHQLVLNTAVAAQVTQRQQQQQLQQHKLENIHILPQSGDLQQKQIVQITQAGSQPQLMQVIQTSQPQEHKQQQQIIQLTPALQQQLLQVSANSDKPQLVQISHPGGQQQLIQITHAGGQQQLLQMCQQPSQTNQQPPILQLCSVKQEQSVQTSESIGSPQMVLSQSGQPQQVIQVSPALQQQLLSQIPQSVQQQLLQTQSRSVLTQQLLQQDQATTLTQQQQPQQQTLMIAGNETGGQQQQFAIVPQAQLRQLIQDQPSVQNKPVQSHTIATQFTPNNPVPVSQLQQPATTLKQDQLVQSPAVSVITSTASATANMKPFLSRINGVRSFQPVNIVIEDDKTDISTALLADEKLESSPEIPSSSNSNDSSDGPKSQLIINQANSKVIVENHSVTSTGSNTSLPTTNLVNNKNLKLNDLDAELSESSSNQSLPVISIKDTETNLPSCDATNEDSTGMFEDFLINGKASNTMDDSMSNNLMSEDSLLNNIIMREELTGGVVIPDVSISENSVSSDFSVANSIKIPTVESNGAARPVDKAPKENSFTIPTSHAVKLENNFLVKKDNAIQVDSAETQTSAEHNFTNILKTELKMDEKNVATKNMMLAELLEKNTDKKDPPILNGALRIGEKGLELITKDELTRSYKTTNLSTNMNEKSVICSNKKTFIPKNVDTLTKSDFGLIDTKPELMTAVTSNLRGVGVKRTNDQEVQCDADSKKPRLNGDTTIKMNCNEEDNDESNVKASQSAANLYAALAADVLGDIDGLEEEEMSAPSLTMAPTTNFQNVTPSTATVMESPASQQLYLTQGHNPRSILVATSPSGLTSRVSIMGAGGQQYFVTPQAAIVQGQPQTVLVTQTAQQHGTGAKTIIILQQSQNTPPLTSQSIVTNPQQKVIMQKIAGTSSPVVSVTSASMITSASLANTIKSTQSPKILQTTCAMNSPTPQMTQQFLPVQSVASASSQTLPMAANQITNVFSLNTTNLTQTALMNTQCNQAAQTAVVSQMPQMTQVSALISQGGLTPTVSTVSQIQTTQSSNSRQVKVIKTISHLQSVGPNKMHHQVVQQQQTQPLQNQPQQQTQPLQNQPQHQQPQQQQQHQLQQNVSIINPQTQTIAVPVVTTVAAMTVATTAATVVATAVATTVATPTSTTASAIKPADQGQFLCEWRSCMRSFKTANEVYLHACAAHCPSGSQEIQCLWERCDAMKRKRFSLMTHLYDRHCNPEILKMMAVRRRQISQSGRSEIPPPLPPAPHPGYAPNAALHAIKRHALEFVNPKELQDDNEGPVTKSIRLTSSLILRNVVIYSTSGRRHLRGFEPHLASVALSNVESSRTIAQILFDMNDHNR